MTFAQTSLRVTNLTLTAIAVLAAASTLWLWLEALVYGGTYAFAEALTATVLTLLCFALLHGVEWVQNRRE